MPPVGPILATDRLTSVQATLALQSGHVPSTADGTSYGAPGPGFSDIWGADETQPLSAAAIRLLKSLNVFRLLWLSKFEPCPADPPVLTNARAVKAVIKAMIQSQCEALSELLLDTAKGRPPRMQENVDLVRTLVAEFKSALKWVTNPDKARGSALFVSMPCGLRKSSLPLLSAWANMMRGARGREASVGAVLLIMPTVELCKDVLRNTLLKQMQDQGLKVAHYSAGIDASRAHLIVGCGESFSSSRFYDEVMRQVIRPVSVFVDEADTVWSQVSYRTDVVSVCHWLVGYLNARLVAMSGALNQHRLRDLATSTVFGVVNPDIKATSGDLVDPSIRLLFTPAGTVDDCWVQVTSLVRKLVRRPRTGGQPSRVIVLTMRTSDCDTLKDIISRNCPDAHVAVAMSGKPAPRSFFKRRERPDTEPVNVVVATTVLEVGVSSRFVDAVVVAGGSYSVHGLVQFMHRTARGQLDGRPTQYCCYVHCPAIVSSVVGDPQGGHVAKSAWHANLRRATATAFHCSDAVDRATDLLSAYGIRQFHEWATEGHCLTQFLRQVVNGTEAQPCGLCSNCDPDCAEHLQDVEPGLGGGDDHAGKPLARECWKSNHSKHCR